MAVSRTPLRVSGEGTGERGVSRGLRPGRAYPSLGGRFFGACRTNLPLDRLEQCLGVVHMPAPDDDPHVARVPDVGERISLHDGQVRKLPRLDGTELVSQAERAGAVDRGDLEDGGVGNTRPRQDLHLAVGTEAAAP